MTFSLLFSLVAFFCCFKLCTSFVRPAATRRSSSPLSPLSMGDSQVMSPLELFHRDEGRKMKGLEQALGANEVRTRGWQALKESSIGRELGNVFHMREVIVLFVLFRSYKRILRGSYKIQRSLVVIML